jgi:hypothetical protein
MGQSSRGPNNNQDSDFPETENMDVNEIEEEREDIRQMVENWDAQEEEAFHFVEPMVEEIREEEMVEIGIAGPGPSTQESRHSQDRQNKKFQVYALDEEDDTRFEVEHKSAGRVIKMDTSLTDRWRKLFQNDDMDIDIADHLAHPSPATENLYSPFASELDWRVARWAVKDGIGHNSLNRLLAIPGVSSFLKIVKYTPDPIIGNRKAWSFLL